MNEVILFVIGYLSSYGFNIKRFCADNFNVSDYQC